MKYLFPGQLHSSAVAKSTARAVVSAQFSQSDQLVFMLIGTLESKISGYNTISDLFSKSRRFQIYRLELNRFKESLHLNGFNVGAFGLSYSNYFDSVIKK